MSNQSEDRCITGVDSPASNNKQEPVADVDDVKIVTKVKEIKLEDGSHTNHKEDLSLVSTSVSGNDTSKDGILEGEEGELDYEEDEGELLDASDNKQDIPNKTMNKKQASDAEDGELEDGEVNSDGEEGEILSDQDEKDDYIKKVNKEDGEINEDDLEEGEVRDGDPYSSNQGRIPRKLCRYFVSGSCTWGASCRFLHPGVNDKGAYHMLPHPGQYPVPYVRPPPPPFPVVTDAISTPALQVSTPDFQPEDEEDLMGQGSTATSVKTEASEKETAWERGIRLAKENKKAALRRKEQDTDFEQKRMLLSISVDAEDEDGNKENQMKRQDTRERSKIDDRDKELRSSRWTDSRTESSRYYSKDRDKKKRRSRRSSSSSPERSKYDRRRDETSDREQDVDKKRDRDRSRKSKPDEQKVDRKDKDLPSTEKRSKEPSVSSTKDIETTSRVHLTNKSAKVGENEPSKEESGEGEKTKTYLSISNNRLANEDWHDPWQRNTSPKRRSSRRRSTISSYSSRSRSTSSSSGSSRSSRSRSRTPSSSGSGSRSSSRSVSRSPSGSPSRTPSSSRSMSRSRTHSSESDRSSTSSGAESRKERHESKTSSNKASSRNQSMSRSRSRSGSRSGSGSDSQSHSDSQSDSDRSSSPSRSPQQPTPPPPPLAPPQSPSSRVPRGSPPGAQTDRNAKVRKDRYDVAPRGERVDKYRQSHIMGWNRRDRTGWQNTYGRGAKGGRVSPRRERDQDRRRRSRTPPVRREAEQRRVFEEAPQQGHGVDYSIGTRAMSRDHYNRRGAHSDNSRTSSDSSSNPQAKSSSRNANISGSETWSADRRKQSQSVWMASGSVRYTGHKDIKLTLNKSVGKAPSSSQSSSSSRQTPHSPPRQVEASSSNTSGSSKEPDKKRWNRPVEPEITPRHSTPRDDVTSTQGTSKPIKRAADSVLTPRQVESQSNKRAVDVTTSKRVDDKRADSRPLKRSADSAAANTKRLVPENVSIKQSREPLETPDAKASHASNTSRREELLRELKAVEDAIARKRARIE